MPETPDKDPQGENSKGILHRTTLKVYRFIYKHGDKTNPVGVHEVQRGTGLSSPSLSQYHIRKLVSAGLVKEVGEGYVVDRIIFENMIRIGRMRIPFTTSLVAFFAASLAILTVLLRPATLTP
ncbi:MAG: winged helix-turn-helix domain-containing protein, partial [Nitrososphaerales archaeon]